jgi:AcrR family transcriptional regulator
MLDAMAKTLTSHREGSEARAKILAAAHDVFAATGFRGSTLDAVAKRAGMSRAGVLHHFANKQAILIALLDARDLDLNTNRLPDDSATELLSSMRESIRAILDGRDLVKLAHMLTAEAAEADHPAHDWLVQRSRRIRASMAAAFEASFARGELSRSADSAALAALCLGAIEGLEAQWLADPDEVDVEAGITLLESLIRSALA